MFQWRACKLATKIYTLHLRWVLVFGTVLLLRQELPHLVLQNLICQPEVLPELVKHIRQQHVVCTSRGKLHTTAIAEMYLKVHKVFLISKSGVRNEDSNVRSTNFEILF